MNVFGGVGREADIRQPVVVEEALAAAHDRQAAVGSDGLLAAGTDVVGGAAQRPDGLLPVGDVYAADGGSPSAICFICASDSTVSSRSSMVRTGDLFVNTWLMKRCLRSTMEYR